MLTQQRGWIKPVLLLSALFLIPIVGPMIFTGYALEWARLTAWGVNSAPKQTNIDLKACLSSGARAVFVGLFYTIPALIIGRLIGGVFASASSLFAFAAGIIAIVAELRATIYQEFSAGIQYSRVFELANEDWVGLARILGINIVGNFIIGAISVIALVISSIVFAGVINIDELSYLQGQLQAFSTASSTNTQEALLLYEQAAKLLLPVFLSTAVVAIICGIVLSLVLINAVGLWMLQFNVAQWGNKDAALPARLTPAPYAYTNQAPPTVYTQAPPQQTTVYNQQALPPNQSVSQQAQQSATFTQQNAQYAQQDVQVIATSQSPEQTETHTPTQAPSTDVTGERVAPLIIPASVKEEAASQEGTNETSSIEPAEEEVVAKTTRKRSTKSKTSSEHTKTKGTSTKKSKTAETEVKKTTKKKNTTAKNEE